MDLSGKFVYLSGAMTGHDDWNKQSFDAAVNELTGMGASFVFNPTDGAPNVDDALDHSYYMLIDLHELTQAYKSKPIYDVIAMLPGWEYSYGARIEHSVAIACGIKPIYL